MLFLVISGVIVTVVIWFLLRETILKPIERLASHIKKIRESGDLSHRLRHNSNDEIGFAGTGIRPPDFGGARSPQSTAVPVI